MKKKQYVHRVELKDEADGRPITLPAGYTFKAP